MTHFLLCVHISYSVLELCQFLTSVFPHCYSVCFWCNDVSQHFTFESSFIIVFTVSLSHRYWPTPADTLFSPDTKILLLLLKVACNDFLIRVCAMQCSRVIVNTNYQWADCRPEKLRTETGPCYSLKNQVSRSVVSKWCAWIQFHVCDGIL